MINAEVRQNVLLHEGNEKKSSVKLTIFNIYVIQQDTQCFMIQFIRNI